ncbi:aminotransferase class V-fold PLP-dependent enzyme [Natranaerofaba carboxydovora]|uniref:aminotransferase class V-fold PLP-dependent enzyme n=1 Tax=Natranaerofaba carboxydovora TaxID=2742683 RepID=UPI001F130D1F|nr:aminotransferase class V-fold PLP-dependent enzyme [Natranaerofaba carboxydovora]UMZ75176.1 putative cysteine desulfurase [Natranaerofaba carboxydovora]
MIYLDNAATSWPKPKEVYNAMDNFMRNIGANPGRGGHRMSIESGKIIMRTREKLAKLFNATDSRSMIFTLNATDSINMVIKGLLKEGDHVITTALEHNSVVRPLKRMADDYIELDILKPDQKGFINIDEIRKLIKPSTRLVAISHASNVIGTIQPIEEIGIMLKDYTYTKVLVDAAQTAGIVPIDVDRGGIDFLAFPGHKGLMGPQGIGGLYIANDCDLDFWREGGTGSKSESPYHPEDLPDKLESGTPNTPGIAGLEAGIDYILGRGIDNVLNQKQNLAKELLEGLSDITEIEIYGPCDAAKISPVISFNIGEENSQEVSFVLDQAFNIASRGGLHCAPLIHEHYDNLDQGAVRFSIGAFNTREDILNAISAVKKIVSELE